MWVYSQEMTNSANLYSDFGHRAQFDLAVF